MQVAFGGEPGVALAGVGGCLVEAEAAALAVLGSGTAVAVVAGLGVCGSGGHVGTPAVKECLEVGRARAVPAPSGPQRSGGPGAAGLPGRARPSGWKASVHGERGRWQALSPERGPGTVHPAGGGRSACRMRSIRAGWAADPSRPSVGLDGASCRQGDAAISDTRSLWRLSGGPSPPRRWLAPGGAPCAGRVPACAPGRTRGEVHGRRGSCRTPPGWRARTRR